MNQRQWRTDLKGWLFILPSFAGFLVFIAFPVLFSLAISFCDWDYTKGLGGICFNGGVNYLNIWRDNWFLASFRNTLVFSLGFVPACLILALFLSVVIDRYVKNPKTCQLFFFMPYISNIVAVSIVWVVMLSSSGPVTMLLRSLGFADVPKWLGNTSTALPCIIVMSVWMNIGYLIMIDIAALQNVSCELYEAAAIDGANALQQLFYVTIPALRPTTFFLLITTVINSFKVFGQIKIMTAGGPGTATSVLVYYIYTSAFSFYNMGYASAMSWVLFILLFTVTVVQLRVQKRRAV